jgi:glyoxylase-like metal-dependent hydrolase (beta-lactamase superfamily II)
MNTWMTKNSQQVTRVQGGRTNIFMVSLGNRSMLIDAGYPGRHRTLVSRLKLSGIGKPEGIVLTHAHFDHAGRAASLREIFGCRVYIHRSEAEFLKRGANPVIRGATALGSIIAFMASIAPEKFLAYPPCHPDISVDDRLDLFDLGPDTYILHTPGHTSGSMSVIVGGEIAVVGDSIFGMSRRSIFPPIAEDQHQLLESWERLLDTGCRIFLPAHGGAKTDGELRLEYGRRGGTRALAAS